MEIHAAVRHLVFDMKAVLALLLARLPIFKWPKASSRLVASLVDGAGYAIITYLQRLLLPGEVMFFRVDRSLVSVVHTYFGLLGKDVRQGG